MFVQTQKTPNPNSLKFLPGKIISNTNSMEFSKKDIVDNHFIRNILSINGVESIFWVQIFYLSIKRIILTGKT